jgi:hypothetical protein
MPPDDMHVADAYAAVEAVYRGRLALRHRAAERQLRRFRTFAACRSVTVGLIVAVALLGEKERTGTRVTLLAIPSAVALAFMFGRRHAARAWHRAVCAAQYYEDRLTCVTGDWAGRRDTGTCYLDAQHPCALDLDLFGVGSLYQRLATARSARGQDTLAAWLGTPADPDAVHARQQAVIELRDRLDLHEELAVRGDATTGPGYLAALVRWHREPIVALPTGTRWLILLAPTAALALAVIGTLLGNGLALLAALSIQVAVAAITYHYAAQAFGPIDSARPTLLPLAHLIARVQRERFTAPLLVQLVAALQSAPRQLAALDRVLAFAIGATLLGCRPLIARRLDAWRQHGGRDLDRWLRAVGTLEALVALATYTYENPDAVFPEVVGGPGGFAAEALGHPLLPRDRCVANDVLLTGERRLLMVSGSNMAGKSTLLRAVGVNAVLALAGAPVRARRLRLGPCIVGATLRVQDSLRAGRSRFYAEALRVRQLLDLATGPVPLLFLLDELFQGTSSHDRGIGAGAVLQTLLDRGAVGLVTTHDLALTEIADRLVPYAVNVHFTDHATDGTLAFDYRLRDGIVPTSNGLALLRAVGIEVGTAGREQA